MIDFTKINFAGEECILITIREKSREPILIINKNEIDNLNKEWNKGKTSDINLNWKNEPATEKQKKFLKENGYKGDLKNLKKGDAADIIKTNKLK